MNNYKKIEESGIVNTIYSNETYDIIHTKKVNNRPLMSINYKTDDLSKININLLNDLMQTCNQLNDLILLINELVCQNLISEEVYRCLYPTLYNVKVLKK